MLVLLRFGANHPLQRNMKPKVTKDNSDHVTWRAYQKFYNDLIFKFILFNFHKK